MIKQVIFDFDGTLANTIDTIIEIANQYAEEFGYEQITKKNILNIQNLDSQKIIKTSNIPLVKIPILLHLVKNELHNNIDNIQPISGLDEVVKNLKKMGFQLGIVSSNSPENINRFITNNNWNHLFEIVCCGTTIFGKAKILRKLLRTENISAEEVIYLGDETRDIDAAKQVNIPAIAVTWGFNSRSVLAKHNPDFLIDRPDEIIDVISQL